MGQAELQVLGIVYQEAEWPGRAQKAQKRDDVGQMEMQRADKVASNTLYLAIRSKDKARGIRVSNHVSRRHLVPSRNPWCLVNPAYIVDAPILLQKYSIHLAN